MPNFGEGIGIICYVLSEYHVHCIGEVTSTYAMCVEHARESILIESAVFLPCLICYEIVFTW